MALSRKHKVYAVLAPIALILLIVAWQAIRVWWNRGYSAGTRTGVVRKLSMKGPPYCKYFSGELVMQNAGLAQPTEVWEFSVDDESEKNPLIKMLQEAEKTGKPVTLKYRQDLGSLYRCTPSEYFVTGLEK